MNPIIRKIYALSGSIYTPKEILNETSLILHISDTPASLYGTLEKFIDRLKPTYIVHTGNFSDHLRHLSDPNILKQYQKSTKRFIDILENSSAKEIYGVFGDLDHPSILREHARRIHWIEDYKDVVLEGIQLRISHHPRYALSVEADFSLFGHDLEILSIAAKDAVFLNGFESIHIISIASREVTHLEYPFSTYDARQKTISISTF